jgi:GH24 family phage-related lysozyme (muramidase)
VATDLPSPDLFMADLIRWEGAVPWMYLDTRGLVTVGVGNLLASSEAAVVLPFQNLSIGQPATKDEILRAYYATAATRPGLSPAGYRRSPRLELSDSAIHELLRHRLANEFIPGLATLCHGFATFPVAAQAAMVDMAFNTGLGGLRHFPKMLAAVRAGDWVMAANECERSSCRPERNAWTRLRFLAAHGSTKQTA